MNTANSDSHRHDNPTLQANSPFRGHSVVVFHRDGHFFAQIEALSMIAAGDTASNALDRLESEIKRNDALFHAARLPTIEPRDTVANRRWHEEVMPFVIKIAAIGVVLVSLILAAGVTTTYILREPVKKSATRLGRAALHQIMRGLSEFAQNEITPEKDAEIRLVVRAAVAKLQPFASELAPFCQSPAAPPPVENQLQR